MSTSENLTPYRVAPSGAQFAQQDDCAATARVFTGAVSNWMALPFDVARERYANAVRAGWIERSMLASAQFGQTLNAMENLTLGPWARKL